MPIAFRQCDEAIAENGRGGKVVANPVSQWSVVRQGSQVGHLTGRAHAGPPEEVSGEAERVSLIASGLDDQERLARGCRHEKRSTPIRLSATTLGIYSRRLMDAARRLHPR